MSLLSLTLLLACAVPSSCLPLHLLRDVLLLLLCLLLPPPLQISKPAEVQEAEQVRPAVSDDTILRWDRLSVCCCDEICACCSLPVLAALVPHVPAAAPGIAVLPFGHCCRNILWLLCVCATL